MYDTIAEERFGIVDLICAKAMDAPGSEEAQYITLQQSWMEFMSFSLLSLTPNWDEDFYITTQVCH